MFESKEGVDSVHRLKKSLSFDQKLCERQRKGYGLCGPVEEARPAEHNCSSVTLGNLLWGRKVKRRSPLPAKSLGPGMVLLHYYGLESLTGVFHPLSELVK